jgi:hypothetical protein
LPCTASHELLLNGPLSMKYDQEPSPLST